MDLKTHAPTNSRRTHFNFVFFVILFYLLFSATTAQNDPEPGEHSYTYKAIQACPEIQETMAPYEEKEGWRTSEQGILIETLDGGIQLASLNADRLFNPASTMKIATTLAALEKWGKDHRFQTTFQTDGTIDNFSETLHGDLILFSEGDPTFRLTMVPKMVTELKKIGIRQVTGNLIINGPMLVNSKYDEYESAHRLFKTLKRCGLKIAGNIYWEKRQGTFLVSHLSEPLIEILYYQNARSSNPIADRIGEALGGPLGLTMFLIEQVGLDLEEIFITHTSGLDYNRISAHAIVKILRKLHLWCEKNDVQIDEVLPVAGLDPSTLSRRFRENEYRGGVLAKTGTLCYTDNGVSALAGFINSKEYGLLVFSILNTRGDVLTFQRWQNKFLKAMIDKAGGMQPFRKEINERKYLYSRESVVNHLDDSFASKY